MDLAEARATLNSALRDFGAAIGLDALSTDDNGLCTLVFDERLDVSMACDPEHARVIIWLVLGTLPDSGRAEATTALLRANAFWQETGGATLSLMPDRDDVIMAVQWPLPGLDGQTVRTLLEKLVERSRTLGALLRPVATGTAPSGGPPLIRA